MLQVRKMPSGGRGEYEIVGEDEAYSRNELAGKEIVVKTKFAEFRTAVRLGDQGGKNRLRIDAGSGAAQITPQVACSMLLPSVTREEERVTGSQPIVFDGRYILDFGFEVLSVTEEAVVIAPVELIARSADITNEDLKARIVAGEREESIRWLIEESGALPPTLNDALLTWRSRLAQGGPLVRRDSETVRLVMIALAEFDALYIPGTDPLPYLLMHAGLSGELPLVPAPPAITPKEPEVRRRAEHAYRLMRARAATSVGFKNAVRAAYDSTCLFCGFRAPSKKNRALPGVDAAHILPYGSFDLDVVQNGIILCKLHHWAFDSRLLILSGEDGIYSVAESSDFADVLENDAPSMAALRSVTGRIPTKRLPRSRELWPSDFYIEQLYRF